MSAAPPPLPIVPLSSITIGDRVRKDMGDLDALAASIREHGLLHPPAVTSAGLLIAGQRRLLACARLGMTEVPVRIIDVVSLLRAEKAENAERKNFTPSEAIAIGRAIETELKTREHERRSIANKEAHARRRNGLDAGETPASHGLSHAEHAAKAIGMGSSRYLNARSVVAAAEQQPDLADLVETMDRTGNVHAALIELKRRRGAAIRHPALKHMRLRDAKRELEHAVEMLTGLAMGIEGIPARGLDLAHVEQWASQIGQQIARIRRSARRLLHECKQG